MMGFLLSKESHHFSPNSAPLLVRVIVAALSGATSGFQTLETIGNVSGYPSFPRTELRSEAFVLPRLTKSAPGSAACGE